MAWLSNWAKRYKITIDHNKVNTDLTDFPVLIPLVSGTGLNSFNPSDFFDELTLISGTVFSENFTASGTNWTHVTGTTTYTSGYMNQAGGAGGSRDDTTASYDFGTNWDFKCRMYANERSMAGTMHNSVYLGYNSGTTNFTLRFYMYSYSTGMGSNNFLRLTKKAGSETVIFTDSQFDYFTNYQTWYWVRARREGTKLYAKIWAYPGGEPTAWNYEVEGAFDGSENVSGTIVVSNVYCVSYVDDITLFTFLPAKDKKIAVTTSDGTTECPVEVECFDFLERKAYYWTKIPTVYSGTDTVFYLYYDKTKNDNVNYVGYTDSTPATQVWDSNYVFVGHMNVTPNKGYLKDSTSYNIDSTAFSVDVNDYFITPGGTSYSFDNSTSDKISFSTNNVVTNISGALTVEALFKFVTGAAGARGIAHKGTDYSVARKSWVFDCLGTGPFQIRAELSNTGSHVASYSAYSASSYDLNTWYYSVLRFTPSVETIIKMNDTTAAVNTTSVPSSLYVNPSPDSWDAFEIGVTYRTDVATYYFDGEIGEVRVSKIARSDAWLKASYHTSWNTFLTFSEHEHKPTYYYQGYIKETGSPVARSVKLYLRSTGALMDSTTSASGNGYYYLTTTVSGDHFIVAFDDDAGTVYNALVLDRLAPTGIE